MSEESSSGELPPRRNTGALLLRGSAVHMLAFSANFFAAFLLMPFLIHHLGERRYGFWVIIGTIVGQLGVLDAGLMSTTQRFMANALARDDRAEGAAIFSTSIVIFWGIGALVFGSVCLIALSAKLWLPSGDELFNFQVALAISGLNLALLFPFAVMQGALTAHFRSDAATVGQVAGTVIRTVLAVATVEMGYGLIGLAAGNLVASLTQRSILLIMMRRHLPDIFFSRAAASWGMAKQLFAFGKFVFLMNASEAARYRLHNLIIVAIKGAVAVTHYSVAIRLIDYFANILSRISNVSTPVYAAHFTSGDTGALRDKFLTLSRLTTIICCVFVSGAVLFGHRFFQLWLGPGFDDSYYALAILSLAMFFSLLQNSSRSLLRAIYKHAFDAHTNMAEVACNLALTLVLVYRWGIVGAAAGMAIPTIIVKGAILPVYVCRTVGLPSRSYAAAIAPFVGFSAFISVLEQWLVPIASAPHLYILLGYGAAHTAVLVAGLFALLPRDDKLALVTAMGRSRIRRVPGGKLLLTVAGV